MDVDYGFIQLSQYKIIPMKTKKGKEPPASRSKRRTSSNTSDIALSAASASLPPNTGPPGSVPVTNSSNSNKNLSHVPCKFYRQGNCQAGASCPFSHNLDGTLAADKLPCKYFQKGNCKFGLKCALAHYLPDGTKVNQKGLLGYGYRRLSSQGYSEVESDQNYFLRGKKSNTINLNSGPICLGSVNSLQLNSLSIGSSAKTSASPTNHVSFATSPTNYYGQSQMWSAFPRQRTFSSPNQTLHSPEQSRYFGAEMPCPPPNYELSSAIADDEDSLDEDVFEEDYVPGSLSDLILTPQELVRRDSRSQSGTLLVRPNLTNILSSAGSLSESVESHSIPSADDTVSTSPHHLHHFQNDAFKKKPVQPSDLGGITGDDVFVME